MRKSTSQPINLKYQKLSNYIHVVIDHHLYYYCRWYFIELAQLHLTQLHPTGVLYFIVVFVESQKAGTV